MENNENLRLGTSQRDRDIHNFVRASVSGLYRAILKRDPENEVVIDEHAARGSVEAIAKALVESEEFMLKGSNPFPKHDRISHGSVLSRHSVGDRPFKAGTITNFLGVTTDVKFCGWAREGVEPILPIPGNFHATEFEWSAALRSVDLAEDTFNVVELGAGWGCWMVNTACAAKRLGKKVFAVGVEGDEGHIEYMGRHAAANDLDPSEIRVERCVAWSDNGFAVFPRSTDSSESYGQEPRFFPNEDEARFFVTRDPAAFDVLEAKTLERICKDIERIDLLHVDIQGGEAALIAQSLEFLKAKVRYIVIGTHGRDLEGTLISTLRPNGWELEIEEPCTLPLPLYGNLPYADGVQGWRNTDLIS